MKYPEYSWIDTAQEHPSRRGHVMRLDQWKALGLPPTLPQFVTWHRFGEDYYHHWQKHHTVAQFSGASYADFLLLDFDHHDLAQALEQARLFTLWLMDVHHLINGVRIYFSGAKGFHFLLDAALFGGWHPSPSLADQLRQLAFRLAQETQLVIDRQIYDRNRLLRVPNTLNRQGQCYKIPLSPEELLTTPITQIQALARQPRPLTFPAWGDCLPIPLWVEWFQEIQAAAKPSPPPLDLTPSFTLFPTRMREGDGRDCAAFQIARYCRRTGWPASQALELLRLWDQAQQDPLGEEQLAIKVKSAYRLAEAESQQLLSIQDLIRAYQARIQQLDQGHRVLLGLPEVDEILRGIAPGEVCTLIARSGVGKSLLAQHLCYSLANLSPQLSQLFLSLEMPAAKILERFGMILGGYSGAELEELFRQEERCLPLKNQLEQQFGDRLLTLTQPTSLAQLPRWLNLAYQRLGRPVDLLLIDYLGLFLDEKGGSIYERVSQQARSLKNLAKEYQIAIFLLAQVGREAGEDGTRPLVRHAARDSGAVEESADFLLGLYRPQMGNPLAQEDRLFVQVLKNRNGREGQTYSYAVDWPHLRIQTPGQLENQSFSPPPEPPPSPRRSRRKRETNPIAEELS